jgi:hypothetical protein
MDIEVEVEENIEDGSVDDDDALRDCAIPTFWCGKSKNPPKSKDPLIKYIRAGNGYECMKKGFGAGAAKERTKSLSSSSLQNIKYVGETHEAHFKKVGIKSTNDLVREMKWKTQAEKTSLLKRILSKSNGVLDKRAYNSTIVYLHRHGVSGIPKCSKIIV